MELIIDDRQDKLNVSEELIEKIKDIIIECLDYEGYDDDYEQSKEYNHSFEREVCFLVCHSTFHLLGYDHDTEENTKQMREKEEYILNKLNITRE